MRRCAVVALAVIMALSLAACGGGAQKAKPPAIGQPYGGGIVAYILQDGDPGYVAGQTHGLIAATADQASYMQWATKPYRYISVSGGTDTAIGTGAANTDAIVAQNGAGSTFAAGLCSNLVEGGYSDWYLPSRDELNKLYLNQAAIGGFESAYYWSSSESQLSPAYAWYQYFVDGYQNSNFKGDTSMVHAVRAF